MKKKYNLIKRDDNRDDRRVMQEVLIGNLFKKYYAPQTIDASNVASPESWPLRTFCNLGKRWLISRKRVKRHNQIIAYFTASDSGSFAQTPSSALLRAFPGRHPDYYVTT